MSDEMIKVAQQYDAAGRFMAHGFVDEFNKLAYNLELEKDAGLREMGTRVYRAAQRAGASATAHGGAAAAKVRDTARGLRGKVDARLDKMSPEQFQRLKDRVGAGTLVGSTGLASGLMLGKEATGKGVRYGAGKGMCKGCGRPSHKCRCK